MTGERITTTHFHGGPWAGETHRLTRQPAHFNVRASVKGRTWRGRYVPDPDSAGGRCYDWQGD